MALMEYCLVNIILGDHEFARAVRKARAGNDQEDSPVTVSINVVGIFVSSVKVLASFQAGDSTPAQLARQSALQIDRYSRILFPLSFFLINFTYGVVFFF